MIVVNSIFSFPFSVWHRMCRPCFWRNHQSCDSRLDSHPNISHGLVEDSLDSRFTDMLTHKHTQTHTHKHTWNRPEWLIKSIQTFRNWFISFVTTMLPKRKFHCWPVRRAHHTSQIPKMEHCPPIICLAQPPCNLPPSKELSSAPPSQSSNKLILSGACHRANCPSNGIK